MRINLSDEKFLNSETDLKHKDIVTIATEGKWQASDTFKDDEGNPSREFRIDFKLSNGEIRNTTLRSTNVKLIGKVLGDETAEWIGEELRAWKTKSEKAKAGFVFLYVPTDWERDDTGEWIIPNEEVQLEDREDSVDEGDVPF